MGRAKLSRRMHPALHLQASMFDMKTRRKGAGRKPKGTRANVSHRARALIKREHPLHIVMRVRSKIPSLRCRAGRDAVRAALRTALSRGDFRICHISIQRTHLHVLVEASHGHALSRGMQGFAVACAKQINRWLDRHGAVFSDRYFATPLRTPTQVRNALSYIFNNWRKHGEDRAMPHGKFDPFSSANAFVDENLDSPWPVAVPRSWFVREGWTRVGRLSFYDRPTASKRSEIERTFDSLRTM